METVPLETAAGARDEPARRAERGETIVVTRDGKPVFDIVPHQRRGGADLAAGGLFCGPLVSCGQPASSLTIIDDPLPEDFLIRPLPEP